MPRQLFTSGIAVSSNKPEIRKRYNAQNEPYANKTQVFNDNDQTTFYLGQTFFIDDGNDGVREYWFESGVASEVDLVLKNPESVRVVDSMDSLKALDDLKQGQYVRTYGYYAGSDLGGGLFRVTDENYKTVILNDSSTLGNINVPSMMVDVGTVFKMKFRINSQPVDASTEDFMEIVDPGGDRISLRSRDLGGNATHTRIDAPSVGVATNFTLRDDAGNEIDWANNQLVEYGEWLDAEIVVTSASAFTNDLNIGYVMGYSMDMEVQWFEINGNKFELGEGSGSTLKSNTAVQGTITGDFSWGDNDPAQNDVTRVKAANDVWLAKQIPNNTVTPFDYGAVNNESVTDYSNDSTAAIQAAIDSGYNVEIPPSRLYITSPLLITSAVQIKMTGSFMPMSDAGHEVTISDEANTTTIIYSDQNIDYIVMQSRNVEIYHGLLYTYGSVDHSKAAIRFDTSKPIWKTDIVGVNVYGNVDLLRDHTKVGTTAFKIDSENQSSSGYLVKGYINGRAFWCNRAVEVTPIDPTTETYVNGIDFTVSGFGCHVYYDFAFGGLFNVTGTGQDANVLPLPYQENGETVDPTTDPRYTAFQFHNCSNSTFDVNLLDPTGVGSHNGNNYAISGYHNTIKGPLLTKYVQEDIELYGVESLNVDTVVKDPIGLVITHQNGFISEFDNAIAFAGNEGNVSYLGYRAVGPHFFDGTFVNPASTYTVADVAPSTDVTVGAVGLLTNTPVPNRMGHKIAEVASRELHFAEIVIDNLETMQNFGNLGLKQLLLKKSGAKINAIECILHFEDFNENPPAQTTQQRLIEPDNAEFLDGTLFNLFGYRYDPNQNNDALRKIIIRLIGQEGSGDAYVFVNDIAVQTDEVRNKPNVNIGGGQTIYGQHGVAEQLSADEFRYTDKPRIPDPNDSNINIGYGGEVLQLKERAAGAIGLYKLNSNDDVIEGTYGVNVVLAAGVESAHQCSIDTQNFATTTPLTPENGTIDVIYRFVNVGSGGEQQNANTYITRLYADNVEVESITKIIRGEEKIESVSFPVNDDYPDGTVFTFTVESNLGGQIGSSKHTSRLRLTKSFLVPRPGAAVTDADTATPTAAENAATINNLLTSLRNAGFIE